MFTKNKVSQDMIDAVVGILVQEEKKEMLLEPGKKMELETGFHMAAHAAKKANQSHFEFQGKKYPVTAKSTAESIEEEKDDDSMYTTKAQAKKIADKEAAKEVHKHEKHLHKGAKETELGEERHMTDDEKNKREHIVKSMKKGLAGFKERYGNRAKNVMYATATKQAMRHEEVDLDEAINDNLHPAGAALLKHIKPEHHNKYKEHLTTDVFNGSYKDRTDVLNAAKKAGHLKEEVEIAEATTGATKLVHTRTGKDGAKYHIMQDSPTDYSIHREHNGKTKHIDTYGSLHRAKSVLDNEVKEEVELDEAKSNYELYHPQYSGAIHHALAHHAAKGLTVHDDDYFNHVSVGPRKPVEGQTVSHHIPATDDKGNPHFIHMQIYNRGPAKKPFELNTYSSKVPKRNVKEEVAVKKIKKPKEESFGGIVGAGDGLGNVKESDTLKVDTLAGKTNIKNIPKDQAEAELMSNGHKSIKLGKLKSEGKTPDGQIGDFATNVDQPLKERVKGLAKRSFQKIQDNISGVTSSDQ